MMLPIGTIGRRAFRPYMTFALIAINFLVFALEVGVLLQGERALMTFFGTYALAGCQIGQESVLLTLRNAVFTMFLHGSWAHVLFNMVFLWVFGPRVEEYFGARRFLLFYLLVGLVASTAHVLLGGVVCSKALPFGADIMIGASGAIAGVMGGFLFLYPASKIRTFVVFLFPRRTRRGWRVDFFRFIPIPAFLYLLFWVGMDILKVIQPTMTNVAHWAHIGGFFAGVGVLFIATMFKPAPAGSALEHLDT